MMMPRGYLKPASKNKMREKRRVLAAGMCMGLYQKAKVPKK